MRKCPSKGDDRNRLIAARLALRVVGASLDHQQMAYQLRAQQEKVPQVDGTEALFTCDPEVRQL